MKFRILMATATAASVLMTAGALADSNVSALAQLGGAGGANTALIEQLGSSNLAKATQEGSSNSLSIKQNGVANWAGTHMKYAGHDFSGDLGVDYNYMLQKGSFNTLQIEQTNKGNTVAYNGNLNQFGDRNETYITQVGGNSSGGIVNTVTQTAASGAAGVTNKLTVVQSGAAPGTYTTGPFPLHPASSDYNYALAQVATVLQTHTVGAANDLYINQSGGTHNAGNTVTLAEQTGSGNQADVYQSGRKNLLTHLEQIDDGNTAFVSHTGYNNVTTWVYQDATLAGGNNASITLNGVDNGQDNLAGAAGLAGATKATVWQSGSGNNVNYTANGDDNAYGFYQDGINNLAENISITGNRNHLGVYQDGDGNKLLLASIVGDDNVLGVKQIGTTNTASVTISSGGSRNGGYDDFSGLPASSSGLTAGLISQKGTSNQAEFKVTGDDNLFASLQEGPASTAGNSNKIKAIVNGSLNQAAVKQIGNSNNASLTQTGGSNNAFITQ